MLARLYRSFRRRGWPAEIKHLPEPESLAMLGRGPSRELWQAAWTEREQERGSVPLGSWTAAKGLAELGITWPPTSWGSSPPTTGTQKQPRGSSPVSQGFKPKSFPGQGHGE